MADDKKHSLRGPNHCPTCGEPLRKIVEGRPCVCIPCLRKEKTPPPYPCDGCEQNNDCHNWQRCLRWHKWALVTWHHINLGAAQLLEEKKEAENDG